MEDFDLKKTKYVIILVIVTLFLMPFSTIVGMQANINTLSLLLACTLGLVYRLLCEIEKLKEAEKKKRK